MPDLRAYQAEQASAGKFSFGFWLEEGLLGGQTAIDVEQGADRARLPRPSRGGLNG